MVLRRVEDDRWSQVSDASIDDAESHQGFTVACKTSRLELAIETSTRITDVRFFRFGSISWNNYPTTN